MTSNCAVCNSYICEHAIKTARAAAFLEARVAFRIHVREIFPTITDRKLDSHPYVKILTELEKM